MISNAIARKAVITGAAVALLFGSLVPARSHAERNEHAGASAVKSAPPAPVIADKDRVSELADRRARVAKTLGAKAALILFSAEPRVYANDVDYQYRQENNLYYLTNLKQRRANLVLLPGDAQLPEILFLPRRNPGA
jgi:Xaa-Pro aminopeptidase